MEEENGEEKGVESTDGGEKANNGEERAESLEEEAEERVDGLGERMEAALKEAVVEKEELPRWIMGRGKARVMGKAEA